MPFIPRLRLVCWCLLLGLTSIDNSLHAAPPRPNVILILCDDLGYGDLGCYGNTRIKTPHLDRMAREGVRFTDFHVAAPLCSPSRAALLTGRYPIRTGVTRVLFPNDTLGLSPTLPTLPSTFKKHGYATAAVGKWHVGHEQAFLPLAHGFDHFFGLPYSNDMGANPAMKTAPGVTLKKPVILPTMTDKQKEQLARDYPGSPLMRDSEIIEHPVDQSTLTRRYTEESIRFIKENREKPFFLYLAHTMPHVPLAASPAFRGRSAGGLYGDVVEELDASVGSMLSTLTELGLDERTLVIFTSDNGPWLAKKENGGTAGPLRDGKFSQHEGGHREPAIAWWPGHIPKNRLCSEFATTMDLLPTFCALAGMSTPPDIDGKDIRPLLFGRGNTRTPHSVFFHGNNALRQGPWKYVVNKDGEELFHLGTDPGEKKNLAPSKPGKVSELRKLLEQWNRSQGVTNTPPISMRSPVEGRAAEPERGSCSPDDWDAPGFGTVAAAQHSSPVPLPICPDAERSA